METECSLPCSLKSATWCILREVNPVHAPPHCFLEEPFVILSPHLRLVLRSGLFPSRFPTKTGFQITHTHTQTQKIDQLQTVSRCKTLPSMPVNTILLTDQAWLCIKTIICSHSLPLYHHLHASRSFCYQIHTHTHTHSLLTSVNQLTVLGTAKHS